MVLYQVCSNYGSMVKMASSWRLQSLYEAAIVLGLFLSVPWVCMQFMSVAFPGHTFFFTLTYI